MTSIPTIDSQRLSSIRFPLIVGVVLIHNHEILALTSTTATGQPWQALLSNFVVNFFSNGIARIAVPILFITSSYIFFTKYENGLRAYKSTIRKKIRSLAIPYAIWNIALFSIFALITFTHTGKPIISDRIHIPREFNPATIIDLILGITKKPIGHHLWFIRDLLLAFIVSPLIHLAIKRTGLAFIVPTTLLWLFDIWPTPTPSLDAVLFFSIGCWIATNKINLFSLDRYLPHFLSIYSLTLIFSTIIGEASTSGRLIHNACIILGIPAAISATKYIYKSHALQTLSSASFFVYAAHDPAISLIRKISLAVIPNPNHITVAALYFIIPAFLILLLVNAYNILNRRLPNLTSVITGGR